MTWTIVEGPVDARAAIPLGEGGGNFDGDVYYFRIEHGDERKTVYVRFRGTLLVEDLSPYPQEGQDAIATQGKSEVERRLGDDSIPRCITFSSGRAEPFEDDDCPEPLMES